MSIEFVKEIGMTYGTLHDEALDIFKNVKAQTQKDTPWNNAVFVALALRIKKLENRIEELETKKHDNWSML